MELCKDGGRQARAAAARVRPLPLRAHAAGAGAPGRRTWRRVGVPRPGVAARATTSTRGSCAAPRTCRDGLVRQVSGAGALAGVGRAAGARGRDHVRRGRARAPCSPAWSRRSTGSARVLNVEDPASLDDDGRRRCGEARMSATGGEGVAGDGRLARHRARHRARSWPRQGATVVLGARDEAQAGRGGGARSRRGRPGVGAAPWTSPTARPWRRPSRGSWKRTAASTTS